MNPETTLPGKLKVTFCAYEPRGRVGGPMSWVLHLLPFLASRGWETELLLFSDLSTDSPMAAELRSKGVRVHCSTLSDFTKHKVRWIFQRVKAHPPDIFVPNLVVPAYMAAAWLRKSGIPTVAVLHSDDAFYRSIQNQFIFGLKFFRVSAVVCVSDFLDQSVRARKGTATVRKIACGVSVPREKGSVPGDVFRVVYFGRLVQEQKRIRELTQSFCDLVQKVEKVEATIIGDGQDRYLVEEVLQSSGNPPRVHLLPSIPNRDVQSELCKYHAVALLSDYEGLPISLLEAMACGLVPVCLNMRSGIPELIQQGVNGLIVEDRGGHFIEAVKRLRDDKVLWSALSQAARGTVENRFSDSRTFENWHEFLLEVDRDAPTRRALRFPQRFVLPPVDSVLSREDFRGETVSRLPDFMKPFLRIAKNAIRALVVRMYRS